MENFEPLVSIGIPTYNRPDGIKRTLECMLAQTYTNLEIIVSDNASPDPDVERIVLNFARHDKRIHYHKHLENKGGVFNFNFVLQQAHGEYFMWAADDDEWSPEYILSLVFSLEKDPSAVGASPPYQLIEEETGNVFKDSLSFNYESRYTLLRLIKFSWYYNDTCIYGLMRKKYLDDDKFIKFKPWAWINASTPYNIVYPMLYFLLSKGNLLSVGKKPLWFKSVTISHGHSAPFINNPLLGYIAHVIRKINLLIRSIHYIYLGSNSALLVFVMIPFLFLRFLYDCITPVYAALYIWSMGKKISQLSPHEIWRLGVR